MKMNFQRYTIHCAVTGGLFCLLTACGGGSSGGDKQEPDPVVVDLPIAYIERPLPVDENGNPVDEDMLNPAAFNPGAALFIKDRAAPGADATHITDQAFAADANYDVKDLEVSPDGRQLVFAMRAPEIPGVDEDEQPTWNIWLYNLDDQSLRRVIASDITAEEGQDVAPAFLPDGRIVFSSTRQRRSKAILLDDNKPQFSALTDRRDNEAFVLHVIEADGSNLQQITFNQSHDLQPTVLDDGRILFNRWDADGHDNVSLYTVTPSGSSLSFYYGYHSQNTGSNNSQVAFQQPRQMPDGRILVALKAPTGSRYGGDMVLIDGDNYAEIDQPTAANAGATGPGQRSLSLLPINTDPNSPSLHGRFNSVYPFYDGSNRLLVSWSQCRLIDPDTLAPTACTEELLADPNAQEADPLYGLWIYNLDDDTQQPLIPPVEGLFYTEAVTMEPRSTPAFIPDPVAGVDLDADLAAEGVGVLHIRSVYDFDGVDTTPLGIPAMANPLQTPADQRPARFLRLVKAVSIPDDDVYDFENTAFGAAQNMREILGYVPIEPDGSVKVKVPADIAFTLSVVDAEGRRIGGRHQNWLTLRSGEERECNGCHTTDSELPHGRPDAEAASANTGASGTGLPFPNSEPALFADMGETMAETYARINGPRTPSVDLIYDDEWTDATVVTKAASFAFRYTDLATATPATASCQTNWNNLCRTVIHYEDHLQPLWELTREITDAGGAVIEDHTCTRCHNTRDAGGALKVPDGQLDLTGGASPDEADHLVSYRELLFDDSVQVVDGNGALVDRLQQATDEDGNPLFQTDADGNPVLDINGNPVPVLEAVPQGSPMSAAGARASDPFFNRFDSGGSHAGYLSPAELRLISEWLDIGGQYFNNPFDYPIN